MRRSLRIIGLVASMLALAGCTTGGSKRSAARPLRTSIDKAQVIVPAKTIGNFLVVEVKWDRFGPYHFLIDTGSSVTLITPALAKRYPGWSTSSGQRRVMGPDGSVVQLPEASLRRLELGGVRFDDVPVLIYDCAPFSTHLGVKIDGVLGFPLFRETLMTLDYPGSRVVFQRPTVPGPMQGTIVRFDDGRKTPVIPVRLGERTFVALIDSGSDMAFSLNPIGLEPHFAFGPTIGATVGTIAGDRTQRVGRLAETLTIGDHAFPRPIVDLSDELSAIGAGVLKNFAVTFDQANDRVAFSRPVTSPIEMPAQRSTGVSFSKAAAYWRVAGVVPKSPADEAGVRIGDLVTRVNGEPVARWELKRYEELIESEDEVAFTFLLGNAETEKRVRVFELVP